MTPFSVINYNLEPANEAVAKDRGYLHTLCLQFKVQLLLDFYLFCKAQNDMMNGITERKLEFMAMTSKAFTSLTQSRSVG